MDLWSLSFPNEDCLLKDTIGGEVFGEEPVLDGLPLSFLVEDFVLVEDVGRGLTLDAWVLGGGEVFWEEFGIVTGRAFGEASGITSGTVKACLKCHAETWLSFRRLFSCVAFQVMKLSAASRRSSAGSQLSQLFTDWGYVM